MAGRDTHKRDCLKLLGNGFPEVHEWLDDYAKIFPPGIFDTYHRYFRHHKEGLKQIGKLFGDKAIKAGRIHLIRDLNHLTESKNKMCIFFKQEQRWFPIYKKNLEARIFEHDKYSDNHELFYYEKGDDYVLVYGKFLKVRDIPELFPELYEQIKMIGG